MIRIKYKPLFDLELRHSYYLNGKSTDLQLIPSEACKVLISAYGLRFLPTGSGGKLYAKVETVSGKDIIKSPIPEAVKFTFLLKVRNVNFENFTALSLTKPKNQHYYFNNLVDNLSGDSSPLLLTNTATKVVTDTDLMTFETNVFSFTDISAETTQNSEIKFIDSGETFRHELENHHKTFNFTYNLKKTSCGRAKFLIGDVERSTFYVTNANDYVGLFGVVEIFYKKTLPQTYQFQLADNSIETKFYKIAFANRATRWRYIINSKFNQAITGVKVAKTSGTPIGFGSFGGAPPGQFIMASGNPVPLREEPVTGIKLTDQADKILISNLPNPPLNLIRQEGTEVFSDVLITI